MIIEKAESTLEIETEQHAGQQRQREGVRFSSPSYLAPTVLVNFVRWVDMGSPTKIRVTIESADGWD